MVRLSEYPLPILVQMAKEAGLDASIVHTKEQLAEALLEDVSLPENPVKEIRTRLHSGISKHLHTIQDGMDKECLACHKAGQSLCVDARAISEYLHNLTMLIEE